MRQPVRLQQRHRLQSVGAKAEHPTQVRENTVNLPMMLR